MPTTRHLLYQKCLKLRAGANTKIFLGESIAINRTHFRIDLESAAPKTFVFVATKNQKEDNSLMRHIRVDKQRREFDFEYYKGDPEDFSELYISVPEDTEFHLAIYVDS